tara:strand:- start:896 stop:1312 length:417 start_codon:yes stop_codon:yes gene_type:complete
MIYLAVIIFLIAQIAILKYFKSTILFILIDRLDVNKLAKRDFFSSDVMTIYVEALENPQRFSTSLHVVDIANSDIMIWRSNSILSRGFYTHEEHLKLKVEKMNKKLTIYDKNILDKLCKSIEFGKLSKIETFFDLQTD